MNTNKIVVTVAVTGSLGDKAKHPVIPVTPKEIAESALEAHSAGAAVAHIHVRDPETGLPSMEFDLYKEVQDRIRSASDMLINLTAGPGAKIIPDDSDPPQLGTQSAWCSPRKRTEHVVGLKPDLCSLDVGSLNFGPGVFANYLPFTEEMAKRMNEAGIKPELEVFDMGHIGIGRHLVETGLVATPTIFQLCMGINWGIPANIKNMLAMIDVLPKDAIWAAFAVGPNSFPMVAYSALLGGNVRVGFEDNFFLSRGVEAKSNVQMVEKAVGIIRALDKEPATVEEAREILCI